MHPIAFWLSLAQEAPPGRPSEWGNLIFTVAVMIVIFYLFLIRPQQREAAEKQKLLDGLKKNDQVVTQGGLLGTVIKVEGDEVLLKVDEQNKVKLRFLKSAIVRVLGPGSPAGEPNKS